MQHVAPNHDTDEGNTMLSLCDCSYSRLCLQGMFLVRHRCIRDCRFPMAQRLAQRRAGQRGAGAAPVLLTMP